MTKLEKGPRGLRRGRGARERIIMATQQLFRDQGINNTGMDQICAVAEVSKRTLYQHFTGKDELIAECLRRFDPEILPEVFDSISLTPRERLLAAFECTRLCARSSQPPSKSQTRAIRRAFMPAITKKPSRHGSSKLPVKLVPPTLRNSANSWRWCWMALQLAAASWIPRPWQPLQLSLPSLLTKPSPCYCCDRRRRKRKRIDKDGAQRRRQLVRTVSLNTLGIRSRDSRGPVLSMAVLSVDSKYCVHFTENFQGSVNVRHNS